MMVRAPVPLHRAWREVGAHAQKRGLHQTPRQHVGAQLHSDEEEGLLFTAARAWALV